MTDNTPLLTRAEIVAQPAPSVPAEYVTDATHEKVMDAIAAALGDAYDCLRVWGAWSYGTMSQDDFVQVVEQQDRLAEIADAAIRAMLASGVQPAPSVPDDIARDADRYRLLRRGQHWSVINGIGDELRAEALDAAIDSVCQTCNGYGMIGGPSYYAPDEGGEPCPDCATKLNAAPERRSASR